MVCHNPDQDLVSIKVHVHVYANLVKIHQFLLKEIKVQGVPQSMPDTLKRKREKTK